MMSLSFSQEFFTGAGEVDLDEMQPSNRPTNVFQAIISLPKKDKVGIARDVLKSPSPVLYVTSEAFPFDVLDKVRETDLCDGCESPVTVYVDADQLYSVTVYDR